MDGGAGGKPTVERAETKRRNKCSISISAWKGVTGRVPQGLKIRRVLGIFINDLKTMVKSKGDKVCVMQN